MPSTVVLSSDESIVSTISSSICCMKARGNGIPVGRMAKHLNIDELTTSDDDDSSAKSVVLTKSSSAQSIVSTKSSSAQSIVSTKSSSAQSIVSTKSSSPTIVCMGARRTSEDVPTVGLVKNIPRKEYKLMSSDESLVSTGSSSICCMKARGNGIPVGRMPKHLKIDESTTSDDDNSSAKSVVLAKSSSAQSIVSTESSSLTIVCMGARRTSKVVPTSDSSSQGHHCIAEKNNTKGSHQNSVEHRKTMIAQKRGLQNESIKMHVSPPIPLKKRCVSTEKGTENYGRLETENNSENEDHSQSGDCDRSASVVCLGDFSPSANYNHHMDIQKQMGIREDLLNLEADLYKFFPWVMENNFQLSSYAQGLVLNVSLAQKVDNWLSEDDARCPFEHYAFRPTPS
ncbi:hypothetical protein GCK72_024794 [Caenorhabditis remanei]|uniref:Uncharacterized protein n=1 Tax=Caenorhabditis remanei TaxID=31234 RepID=A0A6A5G080_CAERE|nr:hypothetical protein GCK72_024794 [Caenorhabditis remanei]KAF1748327.1 hypothetical protein GCK72_024794 [Caenorhabditis remanei]